MKAVIAMSGGVDSSVAAYLLKKQGVDVTGLSFELWDRRDRCNPNVCCSVETIEIAKNTARKIGIDHFTIDVRDDFYAHVIENFCTSYISGITPNPCILCNKFIKFRFLLKKAAEIGADIIATGHYARIEDPNKQADTGFKAHKKLNAKNEEYTERILLKKGVDQKKDQSYVLYVMTQDELSVTMFPLGELKKEQTRGIALQAGLTSFIRAESQEICFVGDGNYFDFIRNIAPDACMPGPIVNTDGKTIGEHKGIALYTIGQRKGLGISTLKPYYVLAINRKNNEIVAGSKEEAMKKTFIVNEVNWISTENPTKPLLLKVKVRSTMKEEPAMIFPELNQRVTVVFDNPQWAPAPGQSAVFYDNDIVTGGGIIEVF